MIFLSSLLSVSDAVRRARNSSSSARAEDGAGRGQVQLDDSCSLMDGTGETPIGSDPPLTSLSRAAEMRSPSLLSVSRQSSPNAPPLWGEMGAGKAVFAMRGSLGLCNDSSHYSVGCQHSD